MSVIKSDIILAWQGRHHDVRLIPCTLGMFTPVISPNTRDLTVVVGNWGVGVFSFFPFFFFIFLILPGRPYSSLQLPERRLW